MIDFTQIPARLNYPVKCKARLSSIHSDIIAEFSRISDHSRRSKIHVITAINVSSYIITNSESFPDIISDCSLIDALNSENYPSDFELKKMIGDLYVDYKQINWDITETSTVYESSTDVASESAHIIHSQPIDDVKTPVEDVLLEPRKIPRFDFSKPWMKQTVSGITYTIPTSLPLKPERSQDITVTTDVNMMSDHDTDRLFPNWFMHTRGVSLYKSLGDIELDPDFGLIFNFDGFTREQVLDNIIKYPYLYNITRTVDGEIRDFYLDIEIDGGLHTTESVWESLGDTRFLPKTKRFMTEYVVRRYLLERDINGVKHRYPIRGSYDPFLVLFMPKEMYIQRGYTNVGKLHVQSRVSYLQMLNPIISFIYGMGNSYCVPDCPFSDQCTDSICDKSCPKNAEMMYLLERNNLSMQSPVFQSTNAMIQKATKYLHAEESLSVVQTEKPVDMSELIAYLACCDKWRGNCCNCSVYNLNFSGYLTDLQRSFSMQNKPDALEYEEIWMNYAPTLIISGLDYIQFKDFSAQEFLNLISNRERDRKKTIIVCSKVDNLAGKGQSFEQLKNWLRKAVVR